MTVAFSTFIKMPEKTPHFNTGDESGLREKVYGI